MGKLEPPSLIICLASLGIKRGRSGGGGGMTVCFGLIEIVQQETD